MAALGHFRRTCKARQEARSDIKVMIMTAFEVDKDLKKTLPSIEKHGFCKSHFTPQMFASEPENI